MPIKPKEPTDKAQSIQYLPTNNVFFRIGKTYVIEETEKKGKTIQKIVVVIDTPKNAFLLIEKLNKNKRGKKYFATFELLPDDNSLAAFTLEMEQNGITPSSQQFNKEMQRRIQNKTLIINTKK